MSGGTIVTPTHTEHTIQAGVTAEQEKQATPAVEGDAYDEEEETIPHMPDPSIWPLVLAFGMTVMVTGIVFNLFVVLAGIAIFVFAIGGWLYQDVQVARREDHH